MKRPPVFRFSTLGLLVALLLLFSHPEPRSVRSEGVVRPGQENDDARRLVKQLGSEAFADRQSAQRQLELLGTQAVASLRRLQLDTTDPEIRWRIAKAIRANSRPRWLTDIDAASRLAKCQGKLLMVFSTIGEINGFSWMGGNLMRAVTFADPVLTDLVNSSLVAAWNNQNPTLNLGNAAQQPKPTPEQVAAYPLGGGSGNMRAYFATPNGQIIHYMQGYWSPKHLRAEIEFALDLYQGLIEQQSASAKLIAAKSLDERIALAVKQQAILANSFPEEFSKPVHSSEIRKRHAALGLKVASYNMAKSMVGQEIKGVLTMLMQQNLMRGIIK